MVSAMPTDGLAQIGARPSVGMVAMALSDMKFLYLIQIVLLMILNSFSLSE